jgi:hypothetical protein
MTWHELYALAVKEFGGDTPGAALEQIIIDHYRQHPQAVANAITKTAANYRNGKVTSPWGVLPNVINQMIEAAAAADTVADHRKAELAAAQWIRTAGLHHDREDELLDDLFGEQGRLRDHRNNQKLVDRMRELWAEHRPTGIKLDQDELDRADHWKTTRPNMPPAQR